MKWFVANYSCLQNYWLGGYRPQFPVLSLLCPQLNLLNSPEKKSCVRHRYVHAILFVPVSRSCTLRVTSYMCSPRFALISKLNVKISKICFLQEWFCVMFLPSDHETYTNIKETVSITLTTASIRATVWKNFPWTTWNTTRERRYTEH